MERKKIVIVGGGFGGVYTYLNLVRSFAGLKNRPEITLISRENYFLFTPLLHEVATGGVRAHDIVQPLRHIVDTRRDRVIVSPAEKIDTEKRVVITACTEVPYDYLVVASGAASNYFNFKPELVHTLKTMEDALRIKNTVLEAFETANRTSDPTARARLLTFVVIGGGPTGVELATELDEFIYGTLCPAYPQIAKNEIKLYLVHGKNELLDSFHPAMQSRAREAIGKQHMITPLLNCQVVEIKKGKVALSNKETLNAETIILTAGVKAHHPEFSSPPAFNPRGQISVNTFLQTPSRPEIFALGDTAALDGGAPFPQTAQVAVQQANIVAKNIAALCHSSALPLTPFHYREKGELVSLGRWKAAAHIGPFNFSGWCAWWLWRTIYAGKLVGWANRLRIVVDWTLDMFYERDISKLTNIRK